MRLSYSDNIEEVGIRECKMVGHHISWIGFPFQYMWEGDYFFVVA